MLKFPANATARGNHLALVASGARVPRPSAGALIEEAHAAEKQGQRDIARAAFEGALYAVSGEADARNVSAVLRWIARTYIGDADNEAALDCLEAALAVAEANGDHAAAGHAINVQAVVRWQQGDLDEAGACT